MHIPYTTFRAYGGRAQYTYTTYTIHHTLQYTTPPTSNGGPRLGAVGLRDSFQKLPLKVSELPSALLDLLT
ncbi:hypothetical protein EON63_23875 [archaeon]|nr:MAG: hypothetical protein EON63_23875 [archaeon]